MRKKEVSWLVWWLILIVNFIIARFAREMGLWARGLGIIFIGLSEAERATPLGATPFPGWVWDCIKRRVFWAQKLTALPPGFMLCVQLLQAPWLWPPHRDGHKISLLFLRLPLLECFILEKRLETTTARGEKSQILIFKIILLVEVK